MALSYGFFNSENGDRLYNADTISTYFKGLVSNGVYADIGDGLQVIAGGGMNVAVKPGRCIIECKWAELDAQMTIAINAASSTLNRYTAIVARCDYTNRLIEIVAKDGTPAANPAKPTMTRDASAYELCLAYVYVGKGATVISQSNITDARANTDVCGWVTGLITQVDTSALFTQWQTAYAEFYASFEAWFATLTSQLQVNTTIEQYEKTITGRTQDINTLDLNTITGYTYDANDIVEVYVNGLRVSKNLYVVDASGVLHIGFLDISNSDGNTLTAVVTKSRIGDPVPGGGMIVRQMAIQNTESGTSSISATIE